MSSASTKELHRRKRGVAPTWSLAFCWKDEPRSVSTNLNGPSLAELFQQHCQQRGIVCLVDNVSLPPARGVRSLLKPIPRTQDVVTSLWPGLESLQSPSVGGNGLLTEGAENARMAELLSDLQTRDHALYWVPARAIPTLSQVEHLTTQVQMVGASPLVGTWKRSPSTPPPIPSEFNHPESERILRHETRLDSDSRYAVLQYDRRIFRALENTPNGDVKPGLAFYYHEEDETIWAWYEGDGVRAGALVARKEANGRLSMAYRHASLQDEFRAGQCFSYPEFLPDGRLRMHEFWRWTTGDRSAGSSQIEEIPAVMEPGGPGRGPGLGRASATL